MPSKTSLDGVAVSEHGGQAPERIAVVLLRDGRLDKARPMPDDGYMFRSEVEYVRAAATARRAVVVTDEMIERHTAKLRDFADDYGLFDGGYNIDDHVLVDWSDRILRAALEGSDDAERFGVPVCQMCGAADGDPCDCHDPQGER